LASKKAEVYYRRPENSPYLWSSSGFDPSVSDDLFRSIDFINADIGFAGGQRGQLYKKTDFSSAGPWELNFELMENQSIASISFPNEKNGMFNSSTEISGTTYALIYHTSNTGETWSATPDSIPDFFSAVLHSPDSLNAWIVGLGGKIYKGVPSTAGINQMSLNFDIKIYPNPSADLVHVEMTSETNEIISYSLSDLTGRLIKNGQWSLYASHSSFRLNIVEVPKGVYMLKLNTENRQGTFRVIKK